MGERCRLIAEISNNANGDLDRARRLLDAAKEAGVAWAKLQCYTPDELVALRGDGPAPALWGQRGWTMRTLYEQAQTPLAWFPTLFAHAASIGLPLFSSVFGRESLAVLEDCGNPMYKIARLDNHHAWLYDLCVATGKPVIVSDTEPRRDCITLWCPPGYPQGELGLSAERFRDFDGFSYHGVAHSDCVKAIDLGARIVEAHMQLASEPSVLERHISLTEHQFTRLACHIDARAHD